jgi:E3 ubiquitin-protein ligase HUWE1
MSEEDRQLYLRFVNGQAKLPSDLSKLNYKHTLRGRGGGDGALPEAHTCYNQIDIPEYTSKEIFRKMLLIAIRFCGEVDGDRTMTSY